MGALEDYRYNIYCRLPSFSLGFVYPDDSRVNGSCSFSLYYFYVLIFKGI